MFEENVITSLAGLKAFAVYFALAIFLLVVFVLIYAKITPYKEFNLISEGNTAASCSLGGALLGFAIPLASAVAHSVGMVDMLVWGLVAMIVQLLTFFAVKKIFPAIVSDIPANQISKGVFLGAVSVVTGVLNAACMTY